MSAMRTALHVESLYRAYRGWLHGWIRRRVGCHEHAADLAQSTFCRLVEHGCSALPDSPRSFLATIARRLLIDDLRRRDLEQAYVECHAALDGAVDALSPERIAEASELLHGICALLAGLPQAVREAFLLRRLEGLDHDSIAARLGLSSRTVKRHVARAYTHFYSYAFPD